MGKISEFNEKDYEVISREYADLKEAAKKRCANQDEIDQIQRAFEFANEAHKGVRRRSGEPYILHPIAVAKIVVSNIGTGMAEDGTIVEVLNGYQGSAFVSINASSNKSDLFSQSGALPGTLVRIGKNNKGNVNECAILYDYRKGEENKNTALNDIYGVFSGYVNNIVDDVVKIGFKSGDAFDYAIRVGSSPVVIYDTTATRNPIYTGSIGDAVTYKNNPAEC